MKNGTWKMENEKWKKELGSYGGNAVVKTILAKWNRNLRVMDPFLQETIGRNMVRTLRIMVKLPFKEQ